MHYGLKIIVFTKIVNGSPAVLIKLVICALKKKSKKKKKKNSDT